MNKMFSQLSQMLFAHSKRLMLVCCILFTTTLAYGGDPYYSKVTVKVQSSSTGKGKVYVKYNDNSVPADTDYEDGTPEEHSANKSETGFTAPTHTYYLFSKANTGCFFKGWAKSNTADVEPGSNTQGWQRDINATKDAASGNSAPTYYAVFGERTVYTDYAYAVAMLVKVDGTPELDEDGNPVKGGGYVSINNSETINSLEASVPETVRYRDANPGIWFYEYRAAAQAGYRFVGWYEQDVLMDQITSTGKVNFEDGYVTIQTYIKKEYSTDLTYSQYTENTSLAENYKANPLVAVFRPIPTYYHTGVAVNIAGEPDERAKKGRVYADANAAGTLDSLNTAGDFWVVSMDNITDTISQLDNPRYSYRYYAQPAEDYAFKGWSFDVNGSTRYEGNPYTYEFTMAEGNTAREKPYRTTPMYAIFEAFFYKRPAVAVATPSKGSGHVYVSLTSASVDDCTEEEMAADSVNTIQVAATLDSHDYPVYYYAKPVAGAEFAGWSTSPDGSNPKNRNSPDTTVTYTTKAKSEDLPHVAAPLYAVFKHDIDIRQQDRMIVYVDDEGNGNINDAKVLIDFPKGKTLTATLTGTDKDLFTLSNRTGSVSGNAVTFDATQGLIELVVAYQGDLTQAKGKQAQITLSGTYKDGDVTVTRPVTITVEEAPVITFLPTDSISAYTIKMTNGSGINYIVNTVTRENTKVIVTHESMCNLEMHHLADSITNSDYYFFGWQMIDGETTTYISYDELCNYQFTKSVKIRAEFIHKSMATYSIQGDETNTPYHDFAAAIRDAEILFKTNAQPQTIILNDSIGNTPVTNVILPKGDYVIPNGVRFLIPGKGSDEFKEDLDASEDMRNVTPNSKSEYIRWNVEEGTSITVKNGGAICILAKLACRGGNGPNAIPYDYGCIALGESCKMTFESGASLYSFGYIIGPKTASVEMLSGSFLREVFQIMGWRGGTATGFAYNSVHMGKKVMPFGQYYIQNIEVPLTQHGGATEKATSGIYMDESVSPADITFFNANDGLFQLPDGYALIRYYDVNTDRIKFTFTKNSTATGNAILGHLSVYVGIDVLGVKVDNMDTKDFVLPIPHNYDFIIDKGDLNIQYDIAFLPGSSLSIAKGASVSIGTSAYKANMFVYDKKYSTLNGTGYFGTGDAEFIAVSSRPDGKKYTRTSASIQDAKLVVDGLLNTTNGYLYTTEGSGGKDYANITSNGGGKVQFATLGTLDETYQAKYGTIANSALTIPVVAAKLLNANGNYRDPAANTIFTYIDGAWKENTSDQRDPVLPEEKDYIPRFTVSGLSTFSTYVGESQTIDVTATANNTNIPAADWSSTKMTWQYQLIGINADQFSYSGNKGTVAVTFTPTSEGTKIATLRITASYPYKDTYGITSTYTYTKDVALTGNATYLNANTLAFADLDVLYVEQGAIALFTGGNNANTISISTSVNGIATILGNTSAATITAAAVGKLTITATQAADTTNHIAATTITKTVEVTKRVVWNWDILYFGTVNENPVTVLDGSPDWTLTKTVDEKNIINFQGTTPDTYTATIEDQIAGKYTGIKFTFKQNGEEIPFESHVIANPQHLRVDVNNDTVFRAVTLSANENVEFASNAVKFTSTATAISQWKMTFIGVPDKIYFTPTGNNTWQIEESANGVNWTTSFPWKYLTSNTDFEMSLLPSTRYLRISYGAGVQGGKTEDFGMLRELYITELADVKADVEKLYMPMELSNPADITSVIPVTKEVVLTYANTAKIYVTTSDSAFTINGSTDGILTIPATTDANPFGIKGVEVVSHPTDNTEDIHGYLYVHEGANLVMQIPIQTYKFPQELPIKLATDKPDGGDRYYYVTTHTHNAEWDGTDGVRTITLQNAVSDADPYLTFAFEGAPTYISFNHTPNVKGTWEIEERTSGGSWTAVVHDADGNDVMNNAQGEFKRFVTATSRELRVIYKSDYAEKVEITNLVIVGDASAIVDPAQITLDNYEDDTDLKDLNVTTINLPNLTITSTNPNFTIQHGTNAYATSHIITDTDSLGENKMTDIPFKVKWVGTDAVEFGTLQLTTTVESVTKELATVELVGIKGTITNGALNIFTGVPKGYDLNGEWEGEKHREVNIRAAFSNATPSVPLFDYVVVYGETTTSDGSTEITRPTTMSGSNAKTPCYIYEKNDAGTAYQFLKRVENTNVKEKAWDMGVDAPDAVTIPDGKTSVSMYINGFCPYASTGYTKAEEGVWYFRANGGDSIDIYLDSCYIYSRAKTDDGHFFADRQDGYSFVEPYVRGSGAVLVFACNDKVTTPMNVTIHTLNHNMLKSHYGCFLQSIAGRAYQASSPVQIRVIDDTYVRASTTTLNFTDEWPASKHEKTGEGIRTNGFLSLQKQVNNAPSIDMGNDRTVVNFNGGQVELQNAQIVSTNYVSSMAICHRAGTFAGVLLAYGMGTDGVGGTVNFNDGTTTVRDMYVNPSYAESYLLDKDADGDYITNSKGEYLTTCLRTPTNTFVTGGSHCMMRACSDPTSQGGAPKDKAGNDGKLLGLYKYPKLPKGESVNYGWEANGTNGLVTPNSVPDGYTVASVTPNDNGTTDNTDDYLNFWFDPNFESSVTPEIDKTISFWKTCMTEIAAFYAGYGGSVGGDVQVAMSDGVQTELVKYLLYCKIDQDIHEVISADDYQAPVKNPAPEGGNYLPIHPSAVGDDTEHYFTNTAPFQVEDQIYYITTATADVWNAFTAPFDVANIYIMETYSERVLQDLEGTMMEQDGEEIPMGRSEIKKVQAKHNADFATFFAVTVALGQQKDFKTIYGEYMAWARMQDTESGLYKGSGDYTLRGMHKLVPFDGSNWAEADFYLNENDSNKNWSIDPSNPDQFITNWRKPDVSDGILMHQGVTYSMLLPFCVGCGEEGASIDDRTFWDYWSGKFLIFESTVGDKHIVQGTDFMDELLEKSIPSSGEAILTGNSTFGKITPSASDVYYFAGELQNSTFISSNYATDVEPTVSFLLPIIPTSTEIRVRGVTTSGEIIYDNNSDDNGNQTPTGNIPTVGGGNDLFITTTANGINIAVAAPQYVRVISSNGAMLFHGMVQTAVDVPLPANGVYVITGENEVHKILY